MTRILAVICLLILPAAAPAQDSEKDSVFASYAAYSAYVDKMITTRQFIDFIQKMGGRDEYTAEQLAAINGNFLSIFRSDFAARSVFREEDLGGGIRREARAYWGPSGYVFFYAILHELPNALVVLNFSLNTKVEAVMNKF